MVATSPCGPSACWSSPSATSSTPTCSRRRVPGRHLGRQPVGDRVVPDRARSDRPTSAPSRGTCHQAKSLAVVTFASLAAVTVLAIAPRLDTNVVSSVLALLHAGRVRSPHRAGLPPAPRAGSGARAGAHRRAHRRRQQARALPAPGRAARRLGGRLRRTLAERFTLALRRPRPLQGGQRLARARQRGRAAADRRLPVRRTRSTSCTPRTCSPGSAATSSRSCWTRSRPRTRR